MRLFKRKDRTQIRFLKARLVLIWLKELVKLRLHKYASRQPLDPATYDNYHEVAGFITNIKWRPELGELNSNRVHNMKACAKRITGICLKPGQYVSLMRLIGNPTIERGYKDGPMLVNGQLKYVSGGGICQVSTTMFNAALVSGMTIVEKWNHTWDVWGENRFIDLGRDATYAYGRRDLIIANPYQCPLVLIMEVDKENLQLIIKVVSAEPVHINSQISAQIDEIPTDTEKDLKAKGYKVYTECLYTGNSAVKKAYQKHEIYKPLYK